MNQSNCLNDLINKPENKPENKLENKPEKSSREAKKSPYQTMMMVLVWTLWLVLGDDLDVMFQFFRFKQGDFPFPDLFHQFLVNG